ncbi:MAG: acyl-CoA dehydrogenase C-terminal domain-containing protein [Gammaproteobacteria bacterium]|nr:acyl-CoA dehydrogenase C-terminal domain-containing protein [Gammaproteobacteria bacterium]
MSDYKAPLNDMFFSFFEVNDMVSHYQSLGFDSDLDEDMVKSIFEEGAKLAEREVAPLYTIGDRQGCQLIDGEVKTPDGFKEAYQVYREGGWSSLMHAEEYGGQGLPQSIGSSLTETIGTANWAWSMYPGLSHGAMETLHQYGTDEQKQTYLTRLVSGEWTGTMCLTEPHCGTDLGLLRTKAVPQDDGSYQISGSKIWISAGDHDFVDNIVHIVLARAEGSPEGVKGISLFVVPKFNVNDDGSIGERNGVVTTGLEHKMGIHGNATCMLSFENAKGYLIGDLNKGLKCMFTFMNVARIGTSIQGLCHAQRAFQHSLEYAKDRLQMRSLTGAKFPDMAADPIIVHPDVRRMLMTQKAITEAGRAYIHYLTKQADLIAYGKDEATKKAADARLGLLTPIGKAFLTDLGHECANLGMQVFGGHGYVKDWPMEQNVRDARIGMIYEGTNGIQSLDLLGRKVALDQAKGLRSLTKEIRQWCKTANGAAKPYAKTISWMTRELEWMTIRILMKARKNPDEIGAASFDYLMFAGYMMMGWMWARSVQAAQSKVDGPNAEFYRAKLETAQFYFDRVLPRTRALKKTAMSGGKSIMSLSAEQFAL